MKFDKETIIALVICTILLFAWAPITNYIWGPPPPPPEQTTTKSESTEPKSKDDITAEKSVEKNADSKTELKAEKIQTGKSEEKPKLASSIPEIKKQLPEEFLENDCIKVTINPMAGSVSSILLKDYFKTDRKTLKKTDQNIVLLENVKNGALSITDDLTWILTDINIVIINPNSPKKIVSLVRTFKTDAGAHFSVSQQWQIKANYTIEYKLIIANLANAPLNLENLKISVGGLPNIHELANDKAPFREEHEITYCDPETQKVNSKVAEESPGIMAMMFGGGKKNTAKEGFEEIKDASANWIGITNKYFTCILVPEKPFEDGIVLRATVHDKEIPENGVKEYVIGETDALVNVRDLPVGTELKMPFEYFAGPKKIPLLKELDPNASKIMKLYMLGMKFLEPLSSLMLNALLWLQSFCGSYGLSIILLTLIVKTILWPVTHRANASMRKMQRINPLIQEVRKKYKDNPQKVNTEMMKLYKEHKVNPLGGCFPILLQMPIFFALYAALSGAVEPRHTAFLWINDLTLPDTVATIFSVPINPLMLTMTGTMVLQQKLTPSAADPAQQRMMMFMPLIMLVMLYSLPSGLTLYWTVSQFISIMQLVVNKKLEQRAEAAEKLQKK